MTGSRAPQSKPVRVFLVDDHPVLRQGIRVVLNREPDLTVCGEADDAMASLAAIQHLKPDVALVDLSLKQSSGLDLIKDLHTHQPRVRLLTLSMHDENFYAERVLQAGAQGYLNKNERAQQLV